MRTFGSLKSLSIFISIPQIWFYFQIILLPLGLFSFWASLWIFSSRVDLNLEIAAHFPCNLKSASTTLFFCLDLYWLFVIKAHQEINLPLGLFSFFLTNKYYPHSLGYYREDYVHFGSLKSLNIFISIPQIWFYFQIAPLPLGLFSLWASLWISSSRVDLNLEIAAHFPCNLKSASTTLFFCLDLYWLFVIKAHQTSLSPTVDPI